jgi:3-hydroxybutyryl-CoA dehydratase
MPRDSQPEMPEDSRPLIWSAPFERLREGQSFQSASREVREADVVAFCALTGDWHPQHWDAGWAAGSAFGERIAHGMLILSMAVGLVPLQPDRVRALRRVGETVFKRPVRFGESIAVTAQVTALRPVDQSAGLVDLALAIRNGQGALVARGGVQVLWAAEGEQAAYWRQAIPDSVHTPPSASVPM